VGLSREIRENLTQLLTNLPTTPISQLEQWLPDQWRQRYFAPSA
jgi:hypothetical protein